MSTATHTQDPKRRALGKGLESLLPARPAAVVPAPAPTTPVESSGTPLEIPLEAIDRNPWQTRSHFDEAKLDELALSIADRKSTRLNSSHLARSRMPSSA